MIGQWCEANIDIDLQNYCNCNGLNFHQHHIHKQKLHQPWTLSRFKNFVFKELLLLVPTKVHKNV